MENLTNYRKKIDLIDGKIVTLLAKRLQFSAKIGKFKKKHDLKIKDIRREKAMIRQRIAYAKTKCIPARFTRTLFQCIFRQSRHIQKLD